MLVGASRCQTASISSFSPASSTPVPILHQVNSVNDDGSYTYGFEAADGTFKLETRSADGKVVGKYGYVDANGERQVFDYNADKSVGFSASGDLVPKPSPEVLELAEKASTDKQLHANRVVNGINIDLDGFSEDRDEDGFVDPIPNKFSSPNQIQSNAERGTVVDGVINAVTPSTVLQHAAPAITTGVDHAALTTQFVSREPSTFTRTQQHTALNDNQLANELHMLFLQQHQLNLLQQLRRNSQHLPGNHNPQRIFSSRSQSF